MPLEPLPPNMLADFDQAFTAARNLVDDLITGYREELRLAVDNGLTREHAIGAFLYVLAEHASMEQVSIALVAAIVRLEEQQDV